MDDHRVIRFVAATGEDSDLELVCGTFHFHVHEMVLAPQSKYFENAMTVEMKEKKERKIEVQEQDPYVVQAFIFFAYKQQYDDHPGNNPDRDEEMTFNAKVYALAEEWQYPSLKDLAKDKFEGLVKDKYMDFDFTRAVRIIYSSTPPQDRVLRLVAARRACAKYHELKTSEAFRRTIAEVAGFGADVANELAIGKTSVASPRKCVLQGFQCLECGRVTRMPVGDVQWDNGSCFYCGNTAHKYGPAVEYGS